MPELHQTVFCVRALATCAAPSLALAFNQHRAAPPVPTTSANQHQTAPPEPFQSHRKPPGCPGSKSSLPPQACDLLTSLQQRCGQPTGAAVLVVFSELGGVAAPTAARALSKRL